MSLLLRKLLTTIVKKALTVDNVKNSISTKLAGGFGVGSLVGYAQTGDLVIGIGSTIICTILFLMRDREKPAELELNDGNGK